MVGLLVIPREMERVTAAWEFGGEGGGLAALDLAKWRQGTGYARIARRERRRLRDWRELVCLGSRV